MNKLSELRKDKGLSMKKVAAELGLPYTTYVGYEKGERKLSDKVLKQFAEYYGVTTDYILGVTNEKNPDTDSARIDDITAYIVNILKDLPIDYRIRAASEIQSLKQEFEGQDIRKESE